MLFHSIPFIFLFLPIVMLGFVLLPKYLGTRALLPFLTAMSLIFYAVWNPWLLFLLLGSIAGNYGMGNLLHRNKKKALLTLGITINLGLLAYFKYAYFLAEIIAQMTDEPIRMGTIVLPLAISFFTFQQIAYLVGCFQKAYQAHSFTEYAFFVSFFPQLIAGPIVRFEEIQSQLHTPDFGRFQWHHMNVGITVFIIGIAKKVLIADSFSGFVSHIFDLPGGIETTSAAAIWQAAISYSFLIYFDFSAYSDMAVGLGLMLGLRLPQNFDSPYKASNIIQFWQRWHMTLSRFLRDYLYIPLGGGRRGALRQSINIMIVMLLGGLWHGAGWQFISWGGLHGLLIILTHVALRAVPNSIWKTPLITRMGTALTFLFVTILWVFFRADNLQDTTVLLRGIVGLGPAAPPAEETIIWLETFLLCLLPAYLIWGCQNTYTIGMAWLDKGLSRSQQRYLPIILGTLLGTALILIFLRGYREFIYFQF